MKSTSVGCKAGECDMSASGTHNPPEFKHAEDMEWEMGRFGNVTKFLFHPRPQRPTEPNAGFLKYAPGASLPLHRHDFAQVWYIIEGEFTFAGKLHGPGTIA
jgi:quercetin dioxygenase-like cupin family protein